MLRTCVLVFPLLACLPAPAQTLRPILTPLAPVTVAPPLSVQRNFAVAPNGTLWAVARVDDTVSPGDARYHLWLRRSLDGGATWSTVADAPTTGDGRGVLLYDSECHRLHVLWHATNGGSYNSVYHQEYDTVAGTWVGAPAVIAAATGAEDQYTAQDLEITPKGTVVLAFSTHRRPPPTWNGNWATGLRVRPRGSSTWSIVYQLNTGSSGVYPNLLAIGETVHACYRSAFGGYGIFYRAFDTANLQFTTAADVPVGPNGNTNLYASNVSVLACDSLGDLYVMYATGLASPGSGALHVAHATAGNYTTWTQHQLVSDPPLTWGNSAFWNYGFSWSGGALVTAWWSLANETHIKVYRRLYLNGRPVGPDITFATSPDNDQFKFLSGHRSPQMFLPAVLLVGSTTTNLPQGQLAFFGDRLASAVRFGASCQGKLTSLPVLEATAVPQLGSSLSLALSNLPPSQPGQLLVGGTCWPGIPLDPIGLLGCTLNQDVLLVFPYQSDASGKASASFPLPNDPNWNGLSVHLQALVLAPTHNPANALLTNSLGVTFR